MADMTEWFSARREHAFLLRCEGHTWEKVGNRLGVSREMASLLSKKFVKEMNRKNMLIRFKLFCNRRQRDA